MNSREHFVIIGGGLAGLSAAKEIRRRNADAPVTLVAGEAHLPYNRPALSRAMADGTPFDELLLEKTDFYQSRHIDVLTGVRAVGIDPAAKTVALADGRALPYTKLLLATGSRPFNPIKGEAGSVPVRVLRSYEDALALMEGCAGKRVILVGGGILGLEAASALHKHGAVITVVEFAPRILPLQTDLAVSHILAAHLEGMGITLRFSASAQQATPKGLLLNNGIELKADLVLASMGVRSDTQLAAAVGLAVGRGVAVGADMRTGHPDIWAAGDCAEYGGRVTAVAGAAFGMGAVAGASMAGDGAACYTPFVPAAVFSLPDFSLFSAGSVYDEADESLLYQNEVRGVYKRLFFTGGKLSGTLFLGENPSAAAARALAAGLPPGEAAGLLLPAT